MGANGFIIRKKEQLVLFDRPRYTTAKLVLIQKRFVDPGLIVEPVVCGKIVVAVVPEEFTMEFVCARRSGQGGGCRPTRRRGILVRRDQRHLANLTHEEFVRQIIER